MGLAGFNVNHNAHIDNHNLADKQRLRSLATAHLKELNVLDCFAGHNLLWSKFKCKTYYGIEKEKHKGRNLIADNLKVIPSIDLSRFNVIDLDSYGVPFPQILLLWKNGTLRSGTVIIYTAIFDTLNGLSRACTDYYGLTKMAQKTTLILARHSDDMFYGMLYNLGIRKVHRYTVMRISQHKHYGYFQVPDTVLRGENVLSAYAQY